MKKRTAIWRSRRLQASHQRKIQFKRRALAKIKPIQITSDTIFKDKFHRPLRYIRVPAKLCLQSNRDDTLAFFNKILSEFKARSRIELVFTDLVAISPGAAIVLAGLLQCWSITNKHGVVLRSEAKWDPVMRQLLGQMGLFGLIKIKNRPLDIPASTSLQFLKFTSGTNVDGANFPTFRELIQKEFGNIFRMDWMFKAISECMANSFQHAYPEDIDGHHIVGKRWWLFGAFDSQSQELTICFYDLGVGIPATLPPKLTESISGALAKVTSLGIGLDARLIQVGMNTNRSSMKLKYRGKGLPSMKKVIDANATSTISVYSSKGLYVYSQGNEPNEVVIDLSGSVPGTLLEWKFKLLNSQLSTLRRAT